MAAPQKGRLVSVLPLLWAASSAAAGLLAPAPTCHIPCAAGSYQRSIQCSWAEWQDAPGPRNYSLHWAKADGGEDQVWTGPSLHGSIPRPSFSSHSELRVWVQVRGPNLTARSNEISFNTGDITKPMPPTLFWSSQEPLDISWTPACDGNHLSMGNCEVRYRRETDSVWVTVETGISVRYELEEGVQPWTVYECQVRCINRPGFHSDWSDTLRLRTPETSPAGELDVWRDCGISPDTYDCVVIWKKLPASQAHGLILGYQIHLSYNNGSDVLVNVSVAEPGGRLVCVETQCYLNSSLTDVSSASVAAYNSRGTTAPSHLPRTVPGQEVDDGVRISMNIDNLTVSWKTVPDGASVKEYVVQCKEAGRPLGQGFHWSRANSSATTVVVQGPFHKYTPYQVFLFTVSHRNQSRQRFSVLSYSAHGIPSRVETLKSLHVSTTHVTLFWEALPLSSQNGVILNYRIGVDGQSDVHIVSASSKQRNMTYELRGLRPGRPYEAWIEAVSDAGPGAKFTTKFKTQQEFSHTSHRNALLIVFGTGLLFIICCIVSVRVCVGEKCCCPMPRIFYEKVPDPKNSKIFKLVRLQLNQPSPWMRHPAPEPQPAISSVEVVRVHPAPETPSDGPLRADRPAECERPARTAYSQMVDSERSNKEPNAEDSWSSSEEEQFVSNYEKHFMPTPQEVLQF